MIWFLKFIVTSKNKKVEKIISVQLSIRPVVLKLSTSHTSSLKQGFAQWGQGPLLVLTCTAKGFP